MAVWLAHDSYDHDPRPNTISVTSLIKSVRAIVLSQRVDPNAVANPDVMDFYASRRGTAIHDSIEYVWRNHYAETMLSLGYPQRVIDKVEINPEIPTAGSLPIYLEQRNEKKIGNWVVVGKFDKVMEGMVEDYKSTGVYTYIKGSKVKSETKQLSMYRMLNPDKITQDQGLVHYIFGDWKKFESFKKGYPPNAIMTVPRTLMSIADTEKMVRDKLNAVDKHQNTPEAELPLCTPEELGQGDPSYKYYSNPATAAAGGQATKVFTTSINEAELHRAKQGKGVVKTVYGDPFECRYCAARDVCSQYASMLRSGVAKPLE